MGAVVATAPGEYDFGQMPIVEPEEGWVQIKLHSAVINPSDVIFMNGKWPIPTL